MQYVSIAAHFSQRQLKLLAKIFFEQADEEKQHAMKFVQYLLDTKAELWIPAIPAPTADVRRPPRPPSGRRSSGSRKSPNRSPR